MKTHYIIKLLYFFFRNFVSDIHAKTGQILNRGSAQQIGGSVGGAYDNTVAVKVELCYFYLYSIIGFLPAISVIDISLT